MTAAPASRENWTTPIVLMVATFASMMFQGAFYAAGYEHRDIASAEDWLAGGSFAVPFMAILLVHEFGHYITGRTHRVDISPPYFIPMPILMFGTLGAVIRIRKPIERRNALIDVGASGPLAGLVVALPILIYGIANSRIERVPESSYIEGHPLLYLGLLSLMKGRIAPSHDVFLSPTALAGWAGLLVTMINLIPVGQLDGGHIAYALWGPRQNRISRWVMRILPVIGIGVGLYYGLGLLAQGVQASLLWPQFLAGWHWLLWAGLLWWMSRVGAMDHPPTGSEPLTPLRSALGWISIVVFILLFMPSWFRLAPPVHLERFPLKSHVFSRIVPIGLTSASGPDAWPTVHLDRRSCRVVLSDRSSRVDGSAGHRGEGSRGRRRTGERPSAARSRSRRAPRMDGAP